jgi:PAS domain S-box-containing protein
MEYKATILVVDDQASAREVLRGLLNREDYYLVFAATGQEALAAATQLVPDLILLDVMLPGMDGFEVCRRLRGKTGLVDVPIIILTSLDDQSSRLQGLEAGADDFIAKPFHREELLARVRTITRLNYYRRLRTLELEAERDRTRSILEALGEAVIVTNATGIIEYINPATITLTGFSMVESLTQTWRTWQSTPAQQPLYDRIFETVLAGRTWQGEVVNRRRDGSLYDAALTVAPLFPPHSLTQPSGFVIVQRDITPLKQAERSKNEFVSNVSHELRTPLSVITLVSDNLEALYDRLPDERRLKMIRDIQKHTLILNDLISDVLEISRIDSGRVSMERSQLDFSELVQEQSREAMPLVQQRLQTLQVEGDETLLVSGNAAQLRRVVRNLLNNANKYTPDGGRIACRYQLIEAPLPDSVAEEWPGSRRLPPGFWAALRVTDTGIGIAPEYMPRLFERFYRAKSEQQIRGTGLGLSIVRELVELHLGHVGVVSTPGTGSTFAVYFPLLTEEMTEAAG